MQFRRRQLQTKKQYYRRIAEVKKKTWAAQHLNEDEFFKSHFQPNEEDSHDHNKNKKIAKNEYRAEQRLRNRVAAQQSRERHRTYVEELERKVKLYEQLLEGNGVVCQNCRKTIRLQPQESESMMSQLVCSPEESSKVPNDVASEQALLNSYLDDQIIRIDNQGATTPFSIFFVVCLVAVIAVFSFSPYQGDMAPRLLSNYQSTLNQLITHSEDRYHEKARQTSDLLTLETLKPHQREIENTSYKQRPVGDIPLNRSQNNTNPASNETLFAPIKSWKKVGKYMCSEPQMVIDKKEQKSKRSPEFLLLRTGKNTTRSEKRREGGDDDGQGQNFRILPREWQRLQISSCFLGEM